MDVKDKIIINSPLVKISKPETIEKINIFLFSCFFIILNKKCINRRENKICKLIEEIWPQA